MARPIDASNGVPLFHQIAAILRDRILSGRLAPGDRLPSETELCAQYSVSRITARRALDELAAEGLADRRRGKGTTVADRPAAPAVRTSVAGWMENISRMGAETEVSVLEFGYEPAPAHVAQALALAPGAEAQRSVRVRALEGRPLSHLETWVPADIGRTYDRADLGHAPLLRLLERCGVEVASARQTITAALAPPDVATALGIQAGAALLDVRRVVMDRAGRPVESIRVLYRPELYRYEMDLTRIRDGDGPRWRADAPAFEPGAGPPPGARDADARPPPS